MKPIGDLNKTEKINKVQSKVTNINSINRNHVPHGAKNVNFTIVEIILHWNVQGSILVGKQGRLSLSIRLTVFWVIFFNSFSDTEYVLIINLER